MLPFITPFRLRAITKAQNERQRPNAMAEMDEPMHP